MAAIPCPLIASIAFSPSEQRLLRQQCPVEREYIESDGSRIDRQVLNLAI